jgi:PAS domain S-box-containing protein
MKSAEPRTATGTTRVPEATASLRERLIEDCPDCIKVLDLEGRLLSMNAGGLKALEIRDLGTVLNALWPDFWEGEDRSKAIEAVKAARAGGTGRFTGFFATTHTKTPKWWDVIVSPIFDASGKPEKLLASSRDVTEWKRDETLLKAIINGTAVVTGGEFFRSLVQNLAKGLGVRYSFVAECLPNNRARSLSATTIARCKSSSPRTNLSWKCRRKVISACLCATPGAPSSATS